MDPAQAIELAAMAHQKGLNDVMDRGDSAVQQFYSGAAVFVTGGSGFLGKQLIEKLLRSCQLKKLFVLLRPRKGKTIQERLDYLLTDPVYDVLRKRQPNFVELLVPVEGDVTNIRLGLIDKDWALLTQEVDTVFHMAATVRFDETLRAATLINVRGTRECLALARECINLKNFVHVSTAYSHATEERVRRPVLERFYPCPMPPDVIIGLAESMDEHRLEQITNQLIKGWPNTYTFTKAVAEELVRSTAADLPVCVVRPPIVVPSFYEPTPGWMDLTALSGPTGIMTGIILGILHVFYVDRHSKLPMTPVDFVNNAVIASAWDAAARRRTGERDIQVYTVSNKDHFITWDFIKVVMKSNSKIASPKAIWYCYMTEVKSNLSYWFLAFFLHYIPAYVMDTVGTLLGTMRKDIPSYVAVFRKIDKFAFLYRFFVANEWYFQDDHVQTMISRMSEADKVIFNCDLKTINFPEYVMVWCVGIRRLIKGWPNTYTFTKAVAEELVRSTAADLPVCVVRPPIVVPSFYEPTPGWMDLTALSGPTGIMTGIILGILHVFYVDRHSKLPMTPVDFVNNAVIASAWDAAARRRTGERDIQVYTVSNKDHFITWDFIKVVMKSNSKIASPKAVWYCYMTEVKSNLSYWFLAFFLHYIPAYVMDTVGTLLGTMRKDIPSYVAVFRKIDKFAFLYRFFVANEWYFQDDHVQTMISRMSEADKVIFNCDLKTINFPEYVMVWCVGIRRYVIKDGLKDSELGYRKQLKFKAANYVLISLYVLIVFSLLVQGFKIINYLFKKN